MRALLRTALLALALGLAFGPAITMAQPADGEGEQGADDQGAESPDESRATSFRAVTGPEAEDVPGGTLLIAAYGVLWVLIFGYVFRLGRLEARTRADVTRLERGLAESSGGGASDDG
ncbi:MAG: CcmD family protein [Deltaproteobacteria bacterium]|nr:CcmD family protein [Deltaproteobacteria bacterium]